MALYYNQSSSLICVLFYIIVIASLQIWIYEHISMRVIQPKQGQVLLGEVVTSQHWDMLVFLQVGRGRKQIVR